MLQSIGCEENREIHEDFRQKVWLLARFLLNLPLNSDRVGENPQLYARVSKRQGLRKKLSKVYV